MSELAARVKEWTDQAQDTLTGLRSQLAELEQALAELEASGTGGGAVSSVFGRTGAVVAAAGDYQASEITDDSASGPGSDVAAAIDDLYAAIPAGSDDIANESSVSGSSVSDALDTLEGLIFLNASHYVGYVTNNYDWTSTTWTGIHNELGTISDQSSSGISRSNSTFTFTDAGEYIAFVKVWLVATSAQYLGIRLRSSGTTLAKDAAYADGGVTVQVATCVLRFTATASMTADLESASSASAVGSIVGTTVDGEVLPVASITIFRVG